MSTLSIRRAFEKRLNAFMPALPTVHENEAYTPIASTPYQRVFLLPATPDNQTMGTKFYIEQGLFQINLYYPQGQGSADAQTQAELLKLYFKRGTSMVEAGVTITVIETPVIGPALPSEDRYVIPISIYYQAPINL